MPRRKRPIRLLTVGSQCADNFADLLSLIRCESFNMRGALYDHLVRGMPERDAVSINEVTQSNFSRKLGQLEDAAATVERMKERAFAHWKNQLTDIKQNPLREAL